jgi:hypothetical protein
MGTVTYRHPDTLQEVTESRDEAPVAFLRTEGPDAVCENSLAEACYFIYYSSEGAITQVRGALEAPSLLPPLSPVHPLRCQGDP